VCVVESEQLKSRLKQESVGFELDLVDDDVDHLGGEIRQFFHCVVGNYVVLWVQEHLQELEDQRAEVDLFGAGVLTDVKQVLDDLRSILLLQEKRHRSFALPEDPVQHHHGKTQMRSRFFIFGVFKNDLSKDSREWFLLTGVVHLLPIQKHGLQDHQVEHQIPVLARVEDLHVGIGGVHGVVPLLGQQEVVV
jgi:hypothetical protein